MVSTILWKEWREQRWKLVFGTVMLLSFTGSFLAAQVGTRQELALAIWILGGLVLALYSAMGVFAPEHDEGTVLFLLSKPVPAWQVFLSKWFMGWLNIAIPMLACTVLLVVSRGGAQLAQGFDIDKLARGLVGGLGLATSFYTLTCCLAPRRASEAFVGLFGLLVVLAMGIHLAIMAVLAIMATRTPSLGGMIFASISPTFWLFLPDAPPEGWYSAVVVTVELAVMAAAMGYGLRKWRRGS